MRASTPLHGQATATAEPAAFELLDSRVDDPPSIHASPGDGTAHPSPKSSRHFVKANSVGLAATHAIGKTGAGAAGTNQAADLLLARN